MLTKANEHVSLLSNQFNQCLNELLQIEKQLRPLFAKLVKAAYTAALAKALSPDSTDQIQHIERLKLIQLALKLPKTPGATLQQTLPTLQLKRKPNMAQDLNIIAYALQVQNFKLGYYELLQALAMALQSETALQLLTQTITDHRNTNTWLRQIIQNVMAPALQ